MIDLTPESVAAMLSGVDPDGWIIENHGEYVPRAGTSKAARVLGFIGHHDASILDQRGRGTVGTVVCASDAALIAAAPALARALLEAWGERDEARADERRKVGRELVELSRGLRRLPDAGVLPFALSEIASRLKIGESVENPVIVDATCADAIERGEARADTPVEVTPTKEKP